jgi:protoheme IX farnesyltransferase
MNATVAHADRNTAQLIREVLGLFKLRIGVLITLTALVGLAVTPAPAPGYAAVLVLALSVLVASASAGAFNQYAEYDTDRLMARTRGRAFVTGALPHSPAWPFVFLGAFFYAVVYTLWLKRRTWLNIVVGGLAGSFAVLAGAAAADPSLGALPLLLAVTLFLWTPPHFWSLAIAHHADYEAAGVPMLPTVIGPQRAARVVFASVLLLVVSSLLPVCFGAGPVYLIGALVGGGYFVSKARLLAQAPDRKSAMGAFFASLVQLSLLLAAASLDAALH